MGVARGREDMAKQRLTLPKDGDGVVNRTTKLPEDEDWLHCGCKWRKRGGGLCIPHAGTAADMKRRLSRLTAMRIITDKLPAAMERS